MTCKILIVNADDFGLSEEVNKAIEIAHCQGILTSASILVNAPKFLQAVEIIKKNPQLSIGVHLNILRGYPISKMEDVKDIVNNRGIFYFKRFRKITKEVRRQIKLEYKAQIEKLINNGVRPSHLDFEKHHGWQPSIYDIACELAKEYSIPAIRNLQEPVFWSIKYLGIADLKNLFMSCCLRLVTSLTKASNNIKTPNYFVGQNYIGKINSKILCKIINNLPDGITEIMVHPGYKSKTLDKIWCSWLDTVREKEFQALLSKDVKECIISKQIKLASYNIFAHLK